MMSGSSRFDVKNLIDHWIDQEQKGKHFPVDFDLAWQIAGYSKKSNAKRKLTAKSSGFVEGEDYLYSEGVPLLNPEQSTILGRSSDCMVLSCDTFKHFCLMAQTDQGRAIRQYFIEAEKKWKLTQQVDPVFANQIELLKVQADIAKANASMMENQRFIIERSEAIASIHGLQGLALIQGRPDAVVEKIERVTETVVCRDGMNVSFEGKSVAQLGKELGFKTGKQFERWLEKHGGSDLICEGMRAVQSPYIPTENIKAVKRLWADIKSREGRQLLLGE